VKGDKNEIQDEIPKIDGGRMGEVCGLKVFGRTGLDGTCDMNEGTMKVLRRRGGGTGHEAHRRKVDELVKSLLMRFCLFKI
jgi:hypothetical protein